MYIDKLDYAVNKHNNTYHNKIQMKLVNVKANAYIDFNVEKMTKILNLKLMVIWEYQNIKVFLKNFIFQIGLKKFLWSKNLIEYLKGKDVAETFCEKIANTNQT